MQARSTLTGDRSAAVEGVGLAPTPSLFWRPPAQSGQCASFSCLDSGVGHRQSAEPAGSSAWGCWGVHHEYPLLAAFAHAAFYVSVPCRARFPKPDPGCPGEGLLSVVSRLIRRTPCPGRIFSSVMQLGDIMVSQPRATDSCDANHPIQGERRPVCSPIAQPPSAAGMGFSAQAPNEVARG
jgi:hypothetical protein